MIGRELAHYHVTEKLGAGGMGEVWRARDTRLHRDVALKFLTAAFAGDRERLARFEREAQLLAALNHPNIAAIHGFEESDGQRFLVLEYVPGETLKGPLPPEEVLPIVHQLIDALEEAHEKGIVHRDLKPANIKITAEGKVKVLDFGLAKALVGDPIDEVASNSPTLAATALTRGAMLLGTAAYMSPEQARGKNVDKRADIFAFGSVLYEMLTGKQAFGGETISDSLAAILTKEPDRALLPADTYQNFGRLLDRCLQKDPKKRLRDIGEARIILDEKQPELTAKAPRRQEESRFPWRLGVLAVNALVLIALALLHFRETPPPPRTVTHFTVPLAQAGLSPRVAISRDGTRLAYLGGPPPGLIHLRFMDQLDARPIAGTEGALGQFFSPDGQWLAFYQGRAWKKVQVIGGATITLVENAPSFSIGSWSADGNIILGVTGSGLFRVSAAGGKPEVLTTPDPKKGERNHNWPEILPGGQAVLFTIGTGASFDDARIAVLSLQTGEQRVLVAGGTFARYVPTGKHERGTGHLVYWRAGSVFAVPFDLRTLQVTGSPVPVVEGVLGRPGLGVAYYAFSDTGTLVYAPGGSLGGGTSLTWVDRQGKAEPLAAPQRDYAALRLSPEGQRIAVSIGRRGERSDIWVYDLARGTLSRLTSQGDNSAPVWTPDGKRVTFRNNQEGKFTLSWAPADGSAPPETLAGLESRGTPDEWSPDGKLLLYSTGGGSGDPQRDLYLLPGPGASAGDRKPRPFLQTPSAENDGAFSPDGRWIAYVSDESQRPEIYVRPAGTGGGKWPVSTDGGNLPRWSRNGRELFYRNRNSVMAVTIEPGPTFRAGTPKLLFEHRSPVSAYDVSPDAKRFVMVQAPGAEPEAGAAHQVHIVLEWFEDIRRRVRAGG